jgi:uncharacterized protein YndB with AHSA1/START domain
MDENTGAIELGRAIRSPVGDVFRAWTDPALLKIWLADRAETDPRVGGRYRLESDGAKEMPGVHVCSGEYLEIVPEERIVKTWVYEGPDPADAAESLLTVRFIPLNERTTEVQLQEEGQGLGSEDERESSRQAWSSALDELERILGEPGT